MRPQDEYDLNLLSKQVEILKRERIDILKMIDVMIENVHHAQKTCNEHTQDYEYYSGASKFLYRVRERIDVLIKKNDDAYKKEI
jgi:hypothetical protein